MPADFAELRRENKTKKNFCENLPVGRQVSERCKLCELCVVLAFMAVNIFMNSQMPADFAELRRDNKLTKNFCENLPVSRQVSERCKLCGLCVVLAFMAVNIFMNFNMPADFAELRRDNKLKKNFCENLPVGRQVSELHGRK